LLDRLSVADAAFVLRLLNEPSFREYIGDKGVRTLGDARAYLEEVAIAHYEKHGFGLYRVRLRSSGEPVGICGLVRRAEFPDPDLGFALLHDHWSRGYAFEASGAVLDFAFRQLGLARVVAMADADNAASNRLLVKLGFRYERMVTMPGEDSEVRQYACVSR
jgi:RimJ/RimL family protein N-acetyltransferase